MIVLTLLLAISLAGLVAAFAVPGMTDLVLLAGPCAIASLYLLLRLRGQGGKGRRGKAEALLVVDGSNVMYWNGDTPQLETVREVVGELVVKGFKPGVMFDANAGYLTTGKHENDRGMAKLLRLPKDRVMVVPKGTPADTVILDAARDLGARIVTNDRYRDWADTYPEIHYPGHLIRGEYRAGKVWFDFGELEDLRP